MPPNARITAPESRLTQVSCPGRIRKRNLPKPRARINHHSAEPRNTPITRLPALTPGSATPNPAKIAANDRIVVGLVRVSPKVDEKAGNSPPPAGVSVTDSPLQARDRI